MKESVHPDFSAYDMTTKEGRQATLKAMLSVRDENHPLACGDVLSLKPELIEFDGDGYAEVAFKPQEWQLNGLRYVQGGYLAAMIDVVCGPMSDICSQGQSAGTLDMVTTYFRPITMADEQITVKVNLVSNTSRVMHFECELLNSKGKTAVKVLNNIMKAKRK